MRRLLNLLLASQFVAYGCSAGRVPSMNQSATQSPPVSPGPQVEYGRPHKFIDALGWTLGIPEKIALWDRRASNHRVSQETEQALSEYLAVNGLETTKVRINQYDPGGEWRRLAENKSVGAGWRYTVGTFYTLGYTLLPGRVFSGFVGADFYNPYTDSIYVYSDIPALALEQGAHAKNVRWREHPGTYAAFTSLPFVSLFPENAAKNEVYAYAALNGTYEEQLAMREALYPQFGSEIGGQASLLGQGPALPFSLVGAGIGHIVDAATPAPRRGRDPFALEAARAPSTLAEESPPSGRLEGSPATGAIPAATPQVIPATAVEPQQAP